MDNLQVLEYIPFGHANAISRAELARRMKVTDRELRSMLQDAHDQEHVILNMQDGHGYFRPLEGEEHLARICQKRELKRASIIFKKSHAIDKFLNHKTEIERNQIDFYEYLAGGVASGK